MDMTYNELTHDEERILIGHAQQGNVKAIHRLIESIYPLIKSNALSAAKLCSMAVDELVNEGVIGAYRSIKMYDPNSPFRFSTYAIGEQGWVSAYIGEAVQKSHLIALSKYKRRKGAVASFVGFDSPIGGDDNLKYSDVISAEEYQPQNMEIEVEYNKEIRNLDDISVHELIDKLPDGIEKEIITQVANGVSCMAFSKEHNMTRMTATRTRDRAIASIRKIIKCRV